MANRHSAHSFQTTPPRNKPDRQVVLDIAALPRQVAYFDEGEKDVAFYDINYPWFWQTIPSKQEVRLYSNLPLDIVRSIFDMAMWERPKPVHLLLVSREVKSWIEPLLYRHIYLKDRWGLGRLYRTYLDWKKRQRRHYNSTERRYLPFQSTKSLILCFYPSSITPMFYEMAALEHIEFWYGFDIEPFIFYPCRGSDKASSTSTMKEVPEDTYYFKNIRHLSLNGASLATSTTFRHRVFRDIAHLNMYFSKSVAWETLRHLQSLTHFALDMVKHRFGDDPLSTEELEFWIPTIVTACRPTVQALIICCIDADNENFDVSDFIRSGSESGTTDGGKTRIPSSVISNPKDYHRIPLHNLQYLSRLALGKVDPRVVVGSATELPDNHTFRNGVIYNTYREQGRWYGHAETHWYEAEQIIKRRLL